MWKYLLWKVFELFRSPLSKPLRFRDLADVPISYVGQVGKSFVVNILENALVFEGTAESLDGGIATTTYVLEQVMSGGVANTDYTSLIKINCGGAT